MNTVTAKSGATQRSDLGREAVVEIDRLTTRFGERLVHDSISLRVYRGEILAIVGGSGSGKSTLLRNMLLLQKPTSGSVRVLDTEVTRLPEARALRLWKRMGALFQYSALFGALTVLENVSVPLREHTFLGTALIEEIAALKIGLVGLAPDAASLYPSQLSGGMRKRAGLARALALDPELLFLDEPVSGLDPVSADALDDLILRLRVSLGLTIVMVTHDIDSLWRVADRVVFLGDAKILAIGSMRELADSNEPRVSQFFQGPRARAATQYQSG
jgi:phospholipid/cholesterol/gamma-HCH transport system ATP-binding protein